MKLKLQNIGIIEEADINIDGITLIAGQNDTGKSTIGKVIYSIIKGFNQDINSFEEETSRMKLYYYQNILKEISKYDNINLNLYQTSEINNEWITLVKKTFSEFNLDPETQINISQKIFHLENYLKKTYNTINQKNEEIETWLKSEFQIFHNVFIGNNNIDFLPKIEIEDLQGKAIVKQKYPDNNFFYTELDNNLEIYLKDVHYIESPFILDNSLQRFVGKNNFQFLNRNRQEELIKSLSNPLPNVNNEINTINDTNVIYSKIHSVISGEITVDLLEGVNYKKNNLNIAIKNTAVGIKSFGIIQLLLKNNRLNNRTLLIIDEPEVHLHPTWQVKYAEILVLLSKELEIPILLTSHSPYFIEALEAYSKKYKYEGSTNFYFAEKNKNGLSSKIIDVTKDITPILGSISDAFYKIQDINDEG